jgi:hypothetical protein
LVVIGLGSLYLVMIVITFDVAATLLAAGRCIRLRAEEIAAGTQGGQPESR